MQLSMFAQTATLPQPAPVSPGAVKGCTLIYEPAGRAREYAALACNVYSGCGHRCVYCYAPSATQRSRDAFSAPHIRPGFLEKLTREAAKYQAAGVTGRVLLSFTTDPYQPIDVEHAITRRTIEILHAHGLSVQVLTKGGRRALRDLDLFTAADAFATTLTLLDEQHSVTWEPGAASPEDRIATIREFYRAGIPTWVSLEPVLNPASALEIIRRTAAFVDLYKVGKLNYHPLARSIDWARFAQDAIALLQHLGKPHYIKDDLAAFLTRTAA
jgi:DNA repair photolyase